MPPHRHPAATTPSRPEAATRREMIDPALLRANWDVRDPTKVGLEIPIDGLDPILYK